MKLKRSQKIARKLPRQKRDNGIIKKVVKLVKLIIIGVVIVVKVFLLLKTLYAIIQFKYMLITFGYLVLSYIKLWLESKRHASPHEIAHYKHAIHDDSLDHHDHHEHHDIVEDDWIHEDWRRKDDNAGNGAQGKTVKKLKDRMMNMMKYYVLGKIIKAKIDLGIKLYMAAIQTKIFLVLLSILAISKIKLLLELKKRPEPSKAVYYEHAQHDHHYDGDGWGHSGEEGGFWGR